MAEEKKNKVKPYDPLPPPTWTVSIPAGQTVTFPTASYYTPPKPRDELLASREKSVTWALRTLAESNNLRLKEDDGLSSLRDDYTDGLRWTHAYPVDTQRTRG